MTRVYITLLAVAVINLAFLALPTSAQDYSAEQLGKLSDIIKVIESVKSLESQKIIDNSLAEKQIEYALIAAKEVTGKEINLEDLNRIIGSDRQTQIAAAIEQVQTQPQVAPNKTVTLMEKVSGYLTLANIALITASLLIVVALAALFGIYIMPYAYLILKEIPLGFYELLVYAACFATFVIGYLMHSANGPYIAILGCFGLIPALSLTAKLHEDTLRSIFSRKGVFLFFSFFLFLTYATLAIIFQSSFIGILAILALEAFLGFSVAVLPGVYMIGFTSESAVPRAGIASLIILALFVTLQILGVTLPTIQVFTAGTLSFGVAFQALQVFSIGALYVCTFVYFLALLISSSRWYCRGYGQYVWIQLVTIISGILALAIGSIWHIPQLQGFGGTFFYLYLLEKYIEIPRIEKHWAWATLFFGIIMYGFALMIKAYPQYFLTAVL